MGLWTDYTSPSTGIRVNSIIFIFIYYTYIEDRIGKYLRFNVLYYRKITQVTNKFTFCLYFL